MKGKLTNLNFGEGLLVGQRRVSIIDKKAGKGFRSEGLDEGALAVGLVADDEEGVWRS